MDRNYFKQTRILDGGMGQELLARGLNPQGTLWSAKALLEEKYHPLIENIHEDFINAGAEVIVTNTFTTRRVRLKENNLENKFEILNKSWRNYKKIKKISKDFSCWWFTPQNTTYSEDTRKENEIKRIFKIKQKF